MTIIYTSGWARKIETLEKYHHWLNTLSTGEEVIVQRFLPQQESCLGSQRECWQFTKAVYHKEAMYVPITGNSTLHLNGIFLMNDRATPVGEVFPQRIVPLHSDLVSQADLPAVYGHAPSFDENWINERCHVFVPYSNYPTDRTERKIKSTFDRTYSRKVIGGHIHIIFDDFDRVKSEISNIGGIFLYAESLFD